MLIEELPSSGTIQLEDNTLYSITPSGNVTFKLPMIKTTHASLIRVHQMVVQVNMTRVVSINVGTNIFFNGKNLLMNKVGTYNIYYEFDPVNRVWVCGAIKKGAL